MVSLKYYQAFPEYVKPFILNLFCGYLGTVGDI